MLELVSEYRILIGVLFAVAAAGVYIWPHIQAAGVKSESATLHASIAADMPDLQSAEKHLRELGRDAAEIVAIFETQIAKRIAEAKAKQ